MKKTINGVPIIDRWSTGNSMTDDFPIEEAEKKDIHQLQTFDENDEIGQAINDIFSE